MNDLEMMHRLFGRSLPLATSVTAAPVSGNDKKPANPGLTYNSSQQCSAGINVTAFEQYANDVFRDFIRHTVSIFGSMRF